MITEAQNTRRIAAETAIIRQYLRAVLALGPTVTLSVDDGECEHAPTRVLARAVRDIRAVDMAKVIVREGHHTQKRIGTLLFVLGNAPDEVLADYGCADGSELEKALDRVMTDLL